MLQNEDPNSDSFFKRDYIDYLTCTCKLFSKIIVFPKTCTYFKYIYMQKEQTQNKNVKLIDLLTTENLYFIGNRKNVHIIVITFLYFASISSKHTLVSLFLFFLSKITPLVFLIGIVLSFAISGLLIS